VYKEYRENLAKYEIVSLVRRVTFGVGEIERIKKDLGPKVKELESGNAFIGRFDAENSGYASYLRRQKRTVVNVNRDLSEIKTQIGVTRPIILYMLAMRREIELKAEQERLERELYGKPR
jgi:chromosome segregation protein